MTLTYIWSSFFLITFVYSIFQMFQGDLDVFTSITNSLFKNAKTAFEIALFLTGTLALWSGLMKIAESCGLIGKIARIISPIFYRLFPDIPKHHPAMGNVFMNFSANMLGLDNAATPLGLKAMQSLETLKDKKGTASNAQIMFLVLNTSGLTIIPISIMMFRVEAGALDPSDIFLPTLMATSITTISAILITAIFQKVIFDKVLILFLVGASGGLAGLVYFFHSLPSDSVERISSVSSNFILYTVIAFIIAFALMKKINVYEHFINGAKEGFEVAIKIIPHLVGMLVAIGVFRESGSMEIITSGLSWLLDQVGLGGEHTKALPIGFMRPLSGSGSRGLMIDAFETYGVDSFLGKLASVMQGSSDTTLYILAVYFGSVSIRNARHAVFCGLAADVIGFISAILVSYLFFGQG